MGGTDGSYEGFARESEKSVTHTTANMEITQEQYDSLLAEVSSLRKENEKMKAVLQDSKLASELLNELFG